MLACMSPIEAQKHRTKLLESPGQNALQAGGARKATDVKNSRTGVLELVNRGERQVHFDAQEEPIFCSLVCLLVTIAAEDFGQNEK